MKTDSFFGNDEPLYQLEQLGKTVYLESSGEPYEGKLAVAWVIVNRATDQRWKDDPAACAHEAWQFSCWNSDEGTKEWRKARLDTMRGTDAYTESVRAACAAYFSLEADPTKGATHYLAERVKDDTYWAKGKIPCAVIGNHLFYDDIA